MLARVYSVKIGVIFGVQFERRKVNKKANLHENWNVQIYSGVFWISLPNIIKIDPYNFELYRFKVGAFFSETQCRFDLHKYRLGQLKWSQLTFFSGNVWYLNV